jgi:hypothetical protein
MVSIKAMGDAAMIGFSLFIRICQTEIEFSYVSLLSINYVYSIYISILNDYSTGKKLISSKLDALRRNLLGDQIPQYSTMTSPSSGKTDERTSPASPASPVAVPQASAPSAPALNGQLNSAVGKV